MILHFTAVSQYDTSEFWKCLCQVLFPFQFCLLYEWPWALVMNGFSLLFVTFNPWTAIILRHFSIGYLNMTNSYDWINTLIPTFNFNFIIWLSKQTKQATVISLSSSPEHEVLRVSYCDHSPSVGICCPSIRRPSVVHSHFLVYTLASTNSNQISTQLGPNVYDHKISDECDYGTNRTRTVRVVCPWIRKFAIFDFVYTLAFANIDQSVPNLATIYMPIRSRMSSHKVSDEFDYE